AHKSLLPPLSPLATFCNLPTSTRFNGCAASPSLSLYWVINSDLRTRDSQLSGLLALPSDHCLEYVQNYAPHLTVHLSCFSPSQRSPTPQAAVESGAPSSHVAVDIHRPSKQATAPAIHTYLSPHSSSSSCEIIFLCKGYYSLPCPSINPKRRRVFYCTYLLPTILVTITFIS
ncbi:hypothetical protein B0H17DRAFT_1052620, partial [Mycena rosella]